MTMPKVELKKDEKIECSKELKKYIQKRRNAFFKQLQAKAALEGLTLHITDFHIIPLPLPKQ